jgi:hypothetical protein
MASSSKFSSITSLFVPGVHHKQCNRGYFNNILEEVCSVRSFETKPIEGVPFNRVTLEVEFDDTPESLEIQKQIRNQSTQFRINLEGGKYWILLENKHKDSVKEPSAEPLTLVPKIDDSQSFPTLTPASSTSSKKSQQMPTQQQQMPTQQQQFNPQHQQFPQQQQFYPQQQQFNPQQQQFYPQQQQFNPQQQQFNPHQPQFNPHQQTPSQEILSENHMLQRLNKGQDAEIKRLWVQLNKVSSELNELKKQKFSSDSRLKTSYSAAVVSTPEKLDFAEPVETGSE